MKERESLGRDVVSRAPHWLLAVCRRPDMTVPEDPGGPDELESDDLQRALIGLAMDHRVLGLAVRGLRTRTAHRAEGLDEVARRLRLRAAVFGHRLARAVETLRDAGCDPIVLKGATVGERFYASPELRYQADIDVLVAPERIRDSVAAMKSLGYHFPGDADRLNGFLRFHFHVPLRHTDGHMIEIHWEVHRADALFRLAAADIRARAQLGGLTSAPTALNPCAEHVVLHLVLQNLQEGFSRLSRIVDVDRITACDSSLDWEFLVHAARAGQMSTATAVTLQIARRLLGSPIPARAIDQLRAGRITSRHIALMQPTSSLMAQRFLDTFAARQLLELWLSRGVLRRIGSIWGLLAKDPEVEALWERRVGPWTRYVRLAKLGLLQIAYYGDGIASLFSHRRRAQMRFWSSHAISSDFL